jgi:hypothetical protein
MSSGDRGERSDADRAFLIAAGALASGVAAQLCAPLREIRDSLAVMVETLDRHFFEASGPLPYPWAETKALRERIAEAYLLSRGVNRLTSDLARAVATQRTAPESSDVNQLVEQAISLARHRIGEDTELAIDLGDLPDVRLVPGGLVLLLARLVIAAAEAARAVPGAVVAIATRRERGERDELVIAITAGEQAIEGDAGAEAAELATLAPRVLESAAGALAVLGRGHFEIRLAVAR